LFNSSYAIFFAIKICSDFVIDKDNTIKYKKFGI